MYWDSVKAANMQHNRSHGDFFTIDSTDGNYDNVDAYSWSTSITNPYQDYDDDDGNHRREENEIVSESTSFPTWGYWYWSKTWFSHAYYYNGWLWDGGAGTIEFWEALSNQWPIGDKYNTVVCCAGAYPFRSYPALPTPPGASAAPQASQSSLDEGGIPYAAAPLALERGYLVAAGREPGDVRLLADVSGGLNGYAHKAQALARATTASGPAQGVITFARPLQAGDVVRLEALGLVVRQIEAVSTLDGQGLRWTFGGDNERGVWERAQLAFADEGVTFVGVVSAEVTVPDRDVLDRVQGDRDVFLVDLSVEDYLRLHPSAQDVGINDLYWLLAGWD
jgi:hypothetical protein